MGVRSSMKPSDAVKMTGFGKQEGIARVDDTRFVVSQAQYGEKKGGGLTTPMFGLQFDETFVDSGLTPVDDSGIEPHTWALCWGNKETKEAVLHFWPANAKGPDAAENEEVGVSTVDGDPTVRLVDIGAEGNTFVSEKGDVPFAHSELMVFMAQLEKKGFKAEIIGRGYAPDFVGLVYEFKTSLQKDVFPKLGLEYRPSGRKDGKGNLIPDVCREVVNVLVRPYEGKGAGKGAAGKSGAAKSGSTGSTTTKTPAPVEADDKIATKTDEIIGKWIADNAGKELPSRSKFYSAIGAKLIDGKTGIGMPATTAWTNQMKALSDDEFGTLGMKYGFTFEDGKVTVNEAE